MRLRLVFPLLASALITSAAVADYGSPPPQPTPSAPAPSPGSPEEAAFNARHEAERYFSDGYSDVAKAGKDLEKGKKDNAAKKYQRARERCQKAVQLDSTYYEAWNLVGFTSRKLGDYPHSFEAYRTALRLKPDFALALEYYGEGLLETGDLAGARQQLAALRNSLPAGVAIQQHTDSGTSTPELAAELEGSIAKYVAAHPEKAAVAAQRDSVTMPTPVNPDSSATPAAGK